MSASASNDQQKPRPEQIAPPVGQQTVIAREVILPEIDNIKPYSLLNSTPEEIVPYFLRGTIPARYKWMPLSGIRPSDAVKCVDGFIKSHLYHLNKIGGNELIRDDVRRKASIILGAARAVMTTDFDIAEADLEPAETETPVLHATVGESTGAKYTILVAQNDPHRDILNENLALTEDDTKSSYRAFMAVERQVWVPKAFKTFADANKDIVRDLMWHKAGHPVSVSIKELAATSPAVKTRLESAKLGSASARLPALENDAVAAQTILKLSEVVSPIWETMGGYMNADAIRIRLQIVHGVAMGTARYMPPVKLDNNVTI
ncbi:hypothetical protein A4A49_40607 [Nicotiana attenuata]|uniref:Uncharacterized protein n=1 Tax=Nicotiana attenuata TaxID=49451 RepID=A0A1J6IML8_NICAT|nr:hypothetical protein A4A49_40607 [Nicotiana attenuata]